MTKGLIAFNFPSFVGFIVFVKNRLISIIKIPKKIVNKGALTDKVMERAGGMCYNAIRYNSKEKECGMRFQEELISKIMTYFTVIPVSYTHLLFGGEGRIRGYPGPFGIRENDVDEHHRLYG